MGKITVGLISNDTVGKKMAGPGMRYWELAKGLSRIEGLEVVLFVPGSCDLATKGVTVRSYRPRKQSSVLKQINGIDVIIAQSLTPLVLRGIKGRGIKYIADLYDPIPVEILEYFRDASGRTQKYAFRYAVVELLNQLHGADHILYATGAQKDLYLGMLTGDGILRPDQYYKDPSLKRYMTEAPFGLSRDALKGTDNRVVAGRLPAIKPSDKLVYWGGGIWNWFDPLTVIKAIEILSRKRSDIKLLFLGTRHPNPNIAMEAMCQKAVEYAKKKGLMDRYVFFNFGWTPFEERVNFLARADIGVSAHFDILETRFSFRTRVLDYLWAGIPIVTTRGDAMANLVEKHKLGAVIDYEDSRGMAAALEKMADDSSLRRKIKVNISKIKPLFCWDLICDRIAPIIKEDRFRSPRPYGMRRWRLLFLFYLNGFLKRYIS